MDGRQRKKMTITIDKESIKAFLLAAFTALLLCNLLMQFGRIGEEHEKVLRQEAEEYQSGIIEVMRTQLNQLKP